MQIGYHSTFIISKFDSFQTKKFIPIPHSLRVDEFGCSHHSGWGSCYSPAVDEPAASDKGVQAVIVLDRGSLLDMLEAHLHA